MTTTTTTVTFGSVTFTGAQIKEARVVESINPLSIELPVSTLELTLYSADGDFSIVNPAGFYANLQYKEPLEVQEVIDGYTVYVGKFYLDTWESQSENLATFRASDAIGLLDGVTYLPEGTSTHHIDPINYYSGGSSSAVLSEDLITDIMTQAGVNFIIDEHLYGITISPATLTNKTWLPVCSCREALQLVLFRIGAYASCTRTPEIVVYPLWLTSNLSSFSHIITSAQKGKDTPVILRPQVTGVELTSHDYAYDSAASQTIIKFDPIAAGTHIITFKEPHANWNYSFAPIGSVTLTDYGSAWAEFTVSESASLNVAGNNWTDTPTLTSIHTTPAPSIDNVLSFDVTTVNKENASTVAQRIYDYYQQRYLQKARLYAQRVAPGDSVLIATQSGKWIAGIIERMDTNLAGGYISDIEVVGVVNLCSNILTANTTVLTGTTLSYTGCLDILSFTLDLQGTGVLQIL
jgi:hypothetical protein